MKKITVLVAALTLSFAAFAVDPPATERPAPQWVLSLGGTGGTAVTGDSESVFGADLSLGRTGFLLLPLEYGLRQSFSYSSVAEDTTLLSSRIYLDATLFSYKKFDLFAGGNVGLTYGNTPLTWGAGPEAGLRYWLKKDVSILGRVEYPFNLNEGRSEEVLKYFLGLQVKF